MAKGTPIAVNKLPRINGGANIENIIENKLNIANKLRSKIFLFFLLSSFKVSHSQSTNAVTQRLHLYKISIKKEGFIALV